ncbi:cysteine-rich secretory protein 2-like [Argopecten irradians]|uniref:cysteine-rich secretory protein 2-like n=1 Tax=Argopecten irradians TaxID=31199 RepID=UPI00372239D2
MKVVTILAFLGVLVVGLCEGEDAELEGAGTMPPEPTEPLPPGISDSKRSDEQDIVKRLFNNFRDIQREENVPSKRDDGDSVTGSERFQSEKRGRRRKGQRKLQEPLEISPEDFEAAKTLEMTGKETPSKCTAQEKIDAVLAHQKVRMLEPGSNIWKIHWDESLARLAQALSDKCVFKHTNLNFGNGTRVGQNLAVIKGSNHTIEKVVQLFYNEKSDYDINGHSFVDFDLVGHYLQLEYWDTVKVGCGVTFCPILHLPDHGDVWQNAYYWACDYWPPLHSKTRPYQIGEPCTQCVVPSGKGIGWMCVDDTCEECNIGEPGCNEPGPCTTFEPDKSTNICKKVKARNYCNKGTPGYKYAKFYCKTTCEFCSGIPESIDEE